MEKGRVILERGCDSGKNDTFILPVTLTTHCFLGILLIKEDRV